MNEMFVSVCSELMMLFVYLFVGLLVVDSMLLIRVLFDFDRVRKDIDQMIPLNISDRQQ